MLYGGTYFWAEIPYVRLSANSKEFHIYNYGFLLYKLAVSW